MGGTGEWWSRSATTIQKPSTWLLRQILQSNGGLPPPNSQLLTLHAACSRVVHLSGAHKALGPGKFSCRRLGQVLAPDAQYSVPNTPALAHVPASTTIKALCRTATLLQSEPGHAGTTTCMRGKVHVLRRMERCFHPFPFREIREGQTHVIHFGGDWSSLFAAYQYKRHPPSTRRRSAGSVNTEYCHPPPIWASDCSPSGDSTKSPPPPLFIIPSDHAMSFKSCSDPHSTERVVQRWSPSPAHAI